MHKVNTRNNKDELIKENSFLRQRVAELEETEDRYRTLIELGNKIGEAVLMLQDIDGKEGIHIYVSDQWPKITGYSREELLSMSFFDLVSSRDKKISMQRHRKKMSGKTIPDLFELTIIRKDGKEAPIEITSAATNYEGKPTNVVYIRDIGERKKAEEEIKQLSRRLQVTLENAPIAIYEKDFTIAKKLFDELRRQGVRDFRKYFYNNPDKLKYCYMKTENSDWSPARKNIFDGYVEEDTKLYYKNPPKESPSYKSQVDTLSRLAEGERYFSKEEPIITVKGNKKYLNIHIFVDEEFKDTLSRVLIYIYDVTDLRSKTEELEKYQHHLEDLVNKRTNELRVQTEQRIEFIRLLVHELKTPLTPLLGASELLSGNLLEEPMATTSKIIHSGALKLEKRIDELLDQARLETGSLDLKRDYINIYDSFNNIVEYVKPRLKIKKQDIVLEISESLPLIWADEERLNQIILNLIDNSFKFTPSNGRIILRTYSDGPYLIVEVKDNGCGIDESKQANLFKPYFQSNTVGENMSGLGLGLFLCKSLVELHGGNINVKSQMGTGSTFAFTIPLTSPQRR